MKTSSSSGVSFCGLLTITFIVLKLCHVIDWSWIWVLSPYWISGAVLLAVFLGSLVYFYVTRPKTPEAKAAAAMEDIGR